ncbi:MAG: GNAT family N-acetyltransferase, partial [Halobacteria archaeon]|nr:GNAT family N-acetyltransferase [Halobacteria archaeon]
MGMDIDMGMGMDIDVEIRELKTQREWIDAFPVMRQLRDHLDKETYLDYMHEMTADGYRLFAGVVDDEIVALAGVGIEVNMYYGRHLWVYELVTDEEHRSEGYGEGILEFLEGWAVGRGCELVALSSGTQRDDAHRFYEDRVGMERASYVYKLL